MNKGILSGIVAYTFWGFFPIYWKLLSSVPAGQIVAHRLVWSLVFLVVLVTLLKEWGGFKGVLNRRVFVLYTIAAVLLSANWLVYIWAVNAGYVVETSLGYFINPLVNVLLGVIILHERLTLAKWIPIGLAAVGVLFLTVVYGSLPWIGLALAFTFGFYGLMKKLSPLGSLHGLTLETAILFIPSIAYMLFAEQQGGGALGHSSPSVTVLLVLSGIVTAVPLLLFSFAARSIPLSTLGLLQYIAPTIQFLLGVLLYHELFTYERFVGFSMIWLALLIFSIGGLYDRRRALAKSTAD